MLLTICSVVSFVPINCRIYCFHPSAESTMPCCSRPCWINPPVLGNQEQFLKGSAKVLPKVLLYIMYVAEMLMTTVKLIIER